MEFQQLIRARGSVRAYKPDPVPDETLQAVLEAARLAPTADNRQAFMLYVVPTAGRRDELRRVYHRDWFSQAPLVIGIVALPGRNWVRRDGHNYYDVDCAIVMDHLILAAHDLGLSTCWVAAFDPAAAREVLGLPPDQEPVAFTPLGYGAEPTRPKQRRPLGDLVFRVPPAIL